MFKKVAIILIPILFILSCDGLLWDGSAEKGDLTISVNNPFYQSRSVQPSRALDIQGKYLYIELAWINDHNLYNLDSNKNTVGYGLWNSTPWGGHAIVTVDLGDWTSKIDAVFKNLPRNKNFQARILLDVDQNTVENHLINNTDALCQTDDNGDVWFSLIGIDLENGYQQVIPLLPTISATTPLDISSVNSSSNSYIDGTSETLALTEPLPGYSKYVDVNIDIDSAGGSKLKDVAIYFITDVNLNVGKALPGISVLYDNGTPVDYQSDNFDLTPIYPKKTISLAYPNIDVNYVNTDFLIGTTIFDGPKLMDPAYNNNSESYDVYWGIVYDNGMVSYRHTPAVYWAHPSGFVPGDLEFKILYLDHSSNLTIDYSQWETIEQIEALGPVFESVWDTFDNSYTNVPGIGDRFVFAESYAFSNFPHVVILARFAGGQEFIYARYYDGSA